VSPPVPAERRDLRRPAAYGAAVLAFLYAAVSAYWTAGGTALLRTVGGAVADLARTGGAAAVLVGVPTVLAKLAGVALALALVRPWGSRLPARLLRWTAVAAGALLALYGGVNVVLGALALGGVFGRPADPTALRWHVGVWDLWFLLWGLLLLAAALPRRTVGTRV
jgi:Protein of unknown function (DUF3995)